MNTNTTIKLYTRPTYVHDSNRGIYRGIYKKFFGWGVENDAGGLPIKTLLVAQTAKPRKTLLVAQAAKPRKTLLKTWSIYGDSDDGSGIAIHARAWDSKPVLGDGVRVGVAGRLVRFLLLVAG